MPRSPIKKHDRDDRTHNIFDRKLAEARRDDFDDDAIDEWEAKLADSLSDEREVTDGDDGPDEYLGCECEQDWTCGPCKAEGRYGGYTWIETRYQGMDDDERYGF